MYSPTIVDGGTAWMARESVVLEADTVDTSITEAPWWDLAQQLKQDLTSIILMSEEHLQVSTSLFFKKILLSYQSQHALVRISCYL